MNGAVVRANCLVLVALLTACAAGPAYRRPEVALPAQWQSGIADPRAAQVSAPWWTRFQSAELERLMETALDNNHDLQAAGSRIAQARASARLAGASLLPSIDARGDIVRDKGAGKSASNRFSAGVGASFEVDLWGKNHQAHAAALGRVQGSVYARQSVKLALQAEVAATYFQLLSTRDRLVVARNTFDNVESVLRLLQAQHQAGAISGLDVLRQQGLVASVQSSIPPLEQEQQRALDALAILLGQPPQGFSTQATTLGSVHLPSIAAGLPSELLERRSDIQQAEANLVAANADINAARAAFFPSIRLTAEGGAASTSLMSLLRNGNLIYNLAAGLATPLFDNGRLQSELDLAKARQDELVHAYRQFILLALREVEDGLSAVQRLTEQAAHQERLIEHAEAAWHMADLRYRNGAADFTIVLDAQRVLLSAQAAREVIALSRYAASVDLYRALGGGWEASSQPSIDEPRGLDISAVDE